MDIEVDKEKLTKKDRRKLNRALKRSRRARQARLVKLQLWGVRVGLAVALAGGLSFWWANREVLPPIDIAGHIEESPQSHILDKPMPIEVQKHMLEHADGEGPPGVVINYNCEDFDCEEDLIDELAGIANQYPEFVYVAPFPGMTKKLAITRYQKIETFDSFDKEALINFISSGKP